MSVPDDPVLLQCLERVVRVLTDIVQGDEYHITVGDGKAVLGLRNFFEAPGYPFDMVYVGSDHRSPEHIPNGPVHRYPTIVVTGVVDSEGGESVTRLLKHLADVQKALEEDLASGETGSLSTLVGWGHLGMVVTDEGELQVDGVAAFRQNVEICLTGDWGEI